MGALLAALALAALALPRVASADVRATPLVPGTVAVVRADGDCLRLRDVPGLAGARLTCLGEGTHVDVLDGAVPADGYRWQRITFGGLSGWAADIYLVPVTEDVPPMATPGPTPIPAPTGAPAAFVLPAPAGTVWRIVAGYNTATHSWADGGDPYAIDIVRDDALTEGTPVLAPVNGTVAWRDGACAVIRETAAPTRILLCHFFPDASLVEGGSVTRGQVIGVVAPPGTAENNGLAHLHVALNDDSTPARPNIPFVGTYTLEGIGLPAVTASNAYAGTVFVSTNGTGAAGTPIVSAPEPEPAPEPPPPPSLSGPIPTSGFGTVLFTGGTNDDLVAAAGCAVERLAFWAFDAGRAVTFLPAAGVPLVNAQWNTLFEGGIPANTILVARCG